MSCNICLCSNEQQGHKLATDQQMSDKMDTEAKQQLIEAKDKRVERMEQSSALKDDLISELKAQINVQAELIQALKENRDCFCICSFHKICQIIPIRVRLPSPPLSKNQII